MKLKKRIDENIKKGFTLPEVIITIVIVGIVAALTMPNLIKNYQRQVTASKLKIAYGMLTKAIQTAEVEHGSIMSWYSVNDLVLNASAETREALTGEFANKYLAPYLRVEINENQPLEQFGYTKGLFNPNGKINKGATSAVRGLILENGMFIAVGQATHAPDNLSYTRTTGLVFMVDIDGPYHGTNTFGKDFFAFSKYFSTDPFFSRLTPFRLYKSTYIPADNNFEFSFYTRDELLNLCKKGDGNATCCGTIIMLDGWKISNDYPWL